MAHPRLRRGLVGAATGAGLVLAWWVVFLIWPGVPRLVDFQGDCHQIGCAIGNAIVSLILTIALVTGLSIAVGWIVLAAVGVRPAWPIAVVGPIFGWIIVQLTNGIADGGSVLWLTVVFAVGYGVAGLLSAPRKA